MNVTKDVITDLYPLYAEKECSSDTRASVEEYLRRNPQDAEELRRVMNTPLPGATPSPKAPEEVQALREARRRVRQRSWLLGFAIFFSLTPLSFLHTGEKTYWLWRESPMAALVYGAFGAACWIAYAVSRNRSNIL